MQKLLELSIGEIDNGWFFSVQLPDYPLVQQYHETELHAIAAAHRYIEEYATLTIKEQREQAT